MMPAGLSSARLSEHGDQRLVQAQTVADTAAAAAAAVGPHHRGTAAAAVVVHMLADCTEVTCRAPLPAVAAYIDCADVAGHHRQQQVAQQLGMIAHTAHIAAVSAFAAAVDTIADTEDPEYLAAVAAPRANTAAEAGLQLQLLLVLAGGLLDYLLQVELQAAAAERQLAAATALLLLLLLQ